MAARLLQHLVRYESLDPFLGQFPDRKFFDVLVDSGIVTVLYWSGLTLVGEVVKEGTVEGIWEFRSKSHTPMQCWFGVNTLVGEGVKEGSLQGIWGFRSKWNMPIQIKISARIDKSFVKAASIEGSLKNSNLTVVANKIDGDTSIFVWVNNRWKEQAAAGPTVQPREQHDKQEALSVSRDSGK